MYHADEFDKLLEDVESKSSFTPKSQIYEGSIDLSSYGMDPVHEGILQTGINKLSNLLSPKLKSKISNEWKHLDEEDRRLLLRLVAGESSVFDAKNANMSVDEALARGFKNKSLTPAKTLDGEPGISVELDVDLSNSGSETFPNVSIVNVNGNMKCNYSGFNTFVGFPNKVKSLEFVSGTAQIESLKGIPNTTDKNASNYSIDLKFTKVNSLKGWKSKDPIKGHVSFRGCGLKDIAVDSPIYITGSLDIRDNPDISVETLKALLLKNHSRNQIIVKGKIYHTLETDGFYNSKKLSKTKTTSDDLGAIYEAKGVNKAGTAMTQEELWAIGPEIIKQAEILKAGKSEGDMKENLTAQVKPEIQQIVSSMASSQLDKNVVAQASQQIVNGMSSEEFRKLMKGLFDNLLKQLNDLMRNVNGGDSTEVDKSVDKISEVIADSIAPSYDEIGVKFEEFLSSGLISNITSLKDYLVGLQSTIHELGKANIDTLLADIEPIVKYASQKDITDNEVQHIRAIMVDFVYSLYVDVLGEKETPSKVDSLFEKFIEGLKSKETVEDVKDTTAATSVDTPQTAPTESAPVVNEPANIPGDKTPAEPIVDKPVEVAKPPAKRTGPAGSTASANTKGQAPVAVTTPKGPAKTSTSTSVNTPKTSATVDPTNAIPLANSTKREKGLAKFTALISAPIQKDGGKEAKNGAKESTTNKSETK